ncbi:hypothetical protein MJO28_007399 [Puccinia striiformis f. sp. tritici]|uniref:Uncharacterized protein n=1 Tax=Puccinia striiformis f. sp. tritici TaxID=168172 RepID=A0ACC0EFB3_9BASI|nr:hypothetical protein MJO28_007399 [Puccinia striiformis f. sp. tritici]
MSSRQELQTQVNSDPLTLEERSARLHSDKYHQNFLEFSNRVAAPLAEKYLVIVEELFERFQIAPRSIGSNMLSSFATGRYTLPWNEIIGEFQIRDDKPTQDKMIQLGFLRRYPEYFDNEEISQQLRISTLEVPFDEGLEILKSATEADILSLDVIRRGYHSEYIGHDQIVTPILKTLNQHAANWRQTDYPGPCTFLIGPTLCGKTRLMMEMGKDVCVVHICLRSPHSIGEPKRSPLATEMLKTLRFADLEEYYVRLTTAILSVTLNFFESASTTKDRKEILQEWYTHHTSTDTNFYSDVQLELEKNRARRGNAVPELARTAQRLRSTPVLKRYSLKVLLAIDEAKALLDSLESQTNFSGEQTERLPRFHFFRRALRNVPDACGLFAILADTNISALNLDRDIIGINSSTKIEEDHTSRSFGIRARPHKVYPPIYEIRTMDRMVPDNPPKTWDDLLSPERLSKYGIPFYGVYLKLAIEDGLETNPATTVHTMARFALNKLLCPEIAGPIKITESRALALLGPTIGVPLHGQARQNAILMASHAAHCSFIDASHDCQYTFYPSQPIYALAANDYLQKNENVLISCIDSLTTVLSDGPIDKEVVGQIASRIIVLCAMNKTAANMKTAKETLAETVRVASTSAAVIQTAEETPVDSVLADSISFPDPVPVSKFLETLTGLSPAELPLDSIDVENKRRLFHQGVMFWNHFMNTPFKPTTESLLECLQRGLALQCGSDQEAFDQVLPIYLKDETEAELDESNVTFCGIRVSNQQNDYEFESSQQSMNPETAQFNLKDHKNPYLALYFALQDTPPDKGNVQSGDNHRLPSHGPEDPRQASLVFYGLDSFQFISLGLRNALKRLIDLRTDLVSRHEDGTIGQEYVKDFLVAR